MNPTPSAPANLDDVLESLARIDDAIAAKRDEIKRLDVEATDLEAARLKLDSTARRMLRDHPPGAVVDGPNGSRWQQVTGKMTRQPRVNGAGVTLPTGEAAWPTPGTTEAAEHGPRIGFGKDDACGGAPRAAIVGPARNGAPREVASC